MHYSITAIELNHLRLQSRKMSAFDWYRFSPLGKTIKTILSLKFNTVFVTQKHTCSSVHHCPAYRIRRSVQQTKCHHITFHLPLFICHFKNVRNTVINTVRM
jgi:hypothetical protein